MEVDILELSQRLEEQAHAASPLGSSFGELGEALGLTVCNRSGVPAAGLFAGPTQRTRPPATATARRAAPAGRSPLAPLHPNLNPFGFTHQRNKAVRKAGAAQPAAGPGNPPRAAPFGSQCSGASDAGSAAVGTPAPQHVADTASARPSPTPFQLFRGRLSFGIDGSSGRKLELGRTTPRVATLAVKRRLTDSPSGGARCARRCARCGRWPCSSAWLRHALGAGKVRLPLPCRAYIQHMPATAGRSLTLLLLPPAPAARQAET